MWKRVTENWERVLFALVGLGCLYYSFDFLRSGRVTEAAAIFAIAFFSFIYSNFARFKRFKGLGFEAELWEDKQKEAADLIERLKAVVAIYSREVVMGRVMRNRFGGAVGGWKGHWALYDEVVSEHAALGQKIDFASLKDSMDRVFMFDICSRASSKIRADIDTAKSRAMRMIEKEHPSPVKDHAGYAKRIAQHRAIKLDHDNLFERFQKENAARYIVDSFIDAQRKLKQDFDIDLVADEDSLGRVRRVVELYENRPIVVTPDLIEWTEEGGGKVDLNQSAG